MPAPSKRSRSKRSPSKRSRSQRSRSQRATAPQEAAPNKDAKPAKEPTKTKSVTRTAAKPKAPQKAAVKATPKKKRRTSARRPRASKLDAASIEEIFARFYKDTPEPKGDLEYSNAFTLLVAVVLSAQATDVGVNKATRALFKLADTPQKMLALGEEAVREHIRTIGLYRNKAKNVIALSAMLIDDHGGEVPNDREALQELPGVGRKTANVVLNNAFGAKTIAVDTHLFRVANRTGLAPGRDPLQVELGLLKVVPEKFLLHAHHWLILHGRYTCVARKPRCPVCPIKDICRYKDKTSEN